MKKRIGLFVFICFLPVIAWFVYNNYQPEIKDIHHQITSKYKQVKHIQADDLSGLDKKNILMFDVRERDEFSVGHLDNAIHVSPSTTASQFFDQYSDLIKDNTVIFYCSVGYRSSQFIHKLQQSQPKLNAYNLEGGIFSWANNNKPIVGEGIHPYNEFWGRLINDKNMIKQ